jgi:hypothetical protein
MRAESVATALFWTTRAPSAPPGADPPAPGLRTAQAPALSASTPTIPPKTCDRPHLVRASPHPVGHHD